MLYSLKDCTDNSMDFIISADTTTHDEIQQIIDDTYNKWSQSNSDNTFIKELTKVLPTDCKLYFIRDLETLYY